MPFPRNDSKPLPTHFCPFGMLSLLASYIPLSFKIWLTWPASFPHPSGSTLVPILLSPCNPGYVCQPWPRHQRLISSAKSLPGWGFCTSSGPQQLAPGGAQTRQLTRDGAELGLGLQAAGGRIWAGSRVCSPHLAEVRHHIPLWASFQASGQLGFS